MYNAEYTHKLLKILAKLQKRNPNDLRNIRKKIAEIIENPEHYKPLTGELKGKRRVHLNTHFVLTFKLIDDTAIFLDYEHHDRVYDKTQ
jgi:YafQ family addiction module toxin component